MVSWCKMKEVQMREVRLGSGTHTVRSHGATVAKTHMHDWLMFVLLVVIEVILYLTPPFYRYVGKDMMTDLRYPLLDNTVPAWAVPMYAVLLPVVIFLVVYYRRRDVYDLHHAILGLLFSILVTAVITDSIKNAVGRPRPDFFWRCFPDGKDVYDHLGNVICHGEKSIIKEGHKSFPSGHTSCSFAGLGFLSLYLSGKLKAFDRKGHVAKLCIVFLPILAACLVAISRVDDYWHHWQDVFAGGLLEAPFAGLVVATFCYLQFFPPPYHPQGIFAGKFYMAPSLFAPRCRSSKLTSLMNWHSVVFSAVSCSSNLLHAGWGPYAYFQELESRASAQADATVNPLNARPMDSHVENQGDDKNGFLGLNLARDLTTTVEDVESGRR
ncbi:hypothetical protein POTOM_015516 [Populus tomentosa]|uniref:Phosphatidic acid phosphatase type 2/haloperoxidase domain-containing protein n=1 Tax=Populus tomentosa TaxID=118781 RepID=A0A8X8A049_POPTO|nr:hypothetical protein POTOM_015516 [Populus tomentosa]